MSRVVRAVEATLEPYAICDGVDDETPCDQSWRYPDDQLHQLFKDTRQRAKDHVRRTGHRVIVITSKRDLYIRQD